MEFADVVRNRRMTRAFSPRPIDPDVVDGFVDLASRAPSAGKTQGWHAVVLEGPDTSRYWDITLPAGADGPRERFRWQRLLDAPVLMVVLADPGAYVTRYGEPDKVRTGLGESPEAWPTPYWTVDSSMAAMTLLLAAEDAGLGALFFGVFGHEDAVRRELSIPDGLGIIGVIALGHAARDELGGSENGSGLSTGDDGAGRSSTRRRRSPAQIVHRGGW